MHPASRMPLLLTLPLVLLTTACGPRGDNEQHMSPGEEVSNGTQPAGTAPVASPTPSAPSCFAFDEQGSLRCSNSGFKARERRVIRDAGAWAAAWADAMSWVSPQPAVPEVDFDTEMVVLAAMGERSSGGYGIAVKGVTPREGFLEVMVEEVSPGATCFVTGALSQPFTAVRVPRTAGEVHFLEQQATQECSP